MVTDLTGACLALLGTVAAAQSVTYDFDRAANFSRTRPTPGLAAPSRGTSRTTRASFERLTPRSSRRVFRG